jgi:tRNA A37 methylthiotransferase MiaB
MVDGGEKASNVQLSFEETYADLKPVRVSDDNVTAFTSIMRGCNNLCRWARSGRREGRGTA